MRLRLRIGTEQLVAISLLASLLAFGVLLAGSFPGRAALLDVAFVLAITAFGVASLSIAREARGTHRAVFVGFGVVAVTAALAMLVVVAIPSMRALEFLQILHDLEVAITLAAMNALLTVYGGYTLLQARTATQELARSVEAERQLSATLEQAVTSRTLQLEDAQRVLQRMWWLGQQVALELNPQRVLDRFLEAVVDIARADGAIVGMVQEDGKIRVVVGTGKGSAFVGQVLPIAGSAMGRVIRSGRRWAIERIVDHPEEVDPGMLALGEREGVEGLAVLPISRRGERIGAVVIGATQPRRFTEVEMERVEALADLLSVALENAELVEALRQTEWRFRTLFRAAPDAVLTVLQSGRVREANDAVREVTAYDPLQVVGRALTELVVEEDRPRLQAALHSAFEGTPARVEVTFFQPVSGTRRLVALAMSRLPQADPPTALLVGRDMTADREMRVRLMESDRLAAVGELVAGVAHEVNNPLSSISAFAQLLLRDGGLTPAQRDSIEVIKAETSRASQVVRDLLAFARRSEPHREPIDLNAVVTRTLRLRGYQLTSNRVQVEQSLGTDLPAVNGDARQLQQVCLNLVTNAIQAMAPLGGGVLAVTTRAVGDDVILEMRDTGPGIPPAVRERIFEPFFTTKEEGEGTGLGLSVSYGIVSSHGGTIEVAESSTAGTTFRVTLHAAPAAALAQPARDSGALNLRSPLAGLRLLFVDDEAALRNGVQSFGEMRGFTVLTAGDGDQALRMIRETGVDAVVCDLRMPGMDGLTFHERLRRERPGLASRTVFVTGDVVNSGRPLPTRQPVLNKPFALERLEEALVAVMRGSH